MKNKLESKTKIVFTFSIIQIHEYIYQKYFKNNILKIMLILDLDQISFRHVKKDFGFDT